MKKILKIALLSPIILILLLLAFLSIKYSPTYVYRTITMNLADVYERIEKFADEFNIVWDTCEFIDDSGENWAED